MSSLNSFSIIGIGTDFVDVKVEIVHPDERIVQTSANFALQIILELFENIKKEYIYNSGRSNYPFTQEEANALIDHEFSSILDDLLQKMRWRKIPISKMEHDKISDSGEFIYKGQKLSILGMESDQHYASLETEYDAFCEEAEKKIRLVELLSVKNYPHWFDRLESWLEHENISYGFDDDVFDLYKDEPFPEYVLRIHIKKQSFFLLEHLKEGAKWESAAYDFGYYCNQFKDNKEAVHQSLLYDSEVCSESDENLNNWWKSLSQEWKLVFNINYFLQCREYYPTLHERFKGMMTLGVFESTYGNEKMEALFVKDPDLNELRNMVSMKILFASGCNIKELSPLKIFKNLKIVELESNPIENLNGLEFQKDLEDLTIVMYDNWPTQKAIEHLLKIKDLTFDPQNQQEFDMIGNMPDLRTFYTYLNFEPEMKVLEKLPKIHKLVGYSPTLSAKNKTVLKKLKKRGAAISWESEEGEF